MTIATIAKLSLVILTCFNNLSYGQIHFTSVPKTVELGQTYTLQYQPDASDPMPADITLCRGDNNATLVAAGGPTDVVANLTTVLRQHDLNPSNTSYSWTVDTGLKIGTDYFLAIVQGGEPGTSDHLEIKSAAVASSSSTATPQAASSTPSPAPTTTPQQVPSGLPIAAKAGLAFSAMILIFLVAAGVFFVLRKRKCKHKEPAALHHGNGDGWALQEKKALAADQTKNHGAMQELDGIDVKQKRDERSELHPWESPIAELPAGGWEAEKRGQ